jgi:hypothetical protein
MGLLLVSRCDYERSANVAGDRNVSAPVGAGGEEALRLGNVGRWRGGIGDE